MYPNFLGGWERIKGKGELKEGKGREIWKKSRGKPAKEDRASYYCSKEKEDAREKKTMREQIKAEKDKIKKEKQDARKLKQVRKRKVGADKSCEENKEIGDINVHPFTTE